jgi:hypothetical protein
VKKKVQSLKANPGKTICVLQANPANSKSVPASHQITPYTLTVQQFKIIAKYRKN